MDEPSVYETEYPHLSPLTQLPQCIEGGGWEQERRFELDGSKRAPALWWPHPEQSAHGIAASDEPVSTIRLKDLWSDPRQTFAAK